MVIRIKGNQEVIGKAFEFELRKITRERKDSKSTPLTNKKVTTRLFFSMQFNLEYAVSFPVGLDFVVFFDFSAVSQLP